MAAGGYLIAGGILMVMLAVGGAVGEQEVPQTAVVILVDTSASFAPLSKHDLEGIRSIARAIEKLTKEEWEQPVSLFWSTIDSASAFSPPPCGTAIQYRPRLVQKDKPGDPTEKRSAARLRAWFDACLQILKSGALTPDKYTDISGAVAMAVAGMEGVKGLRTVVIVSDFEEDLPPGTQPTSFKLHRERIVMVYGPSRSDRQRADRLFDRVEQWEQKFADANAGQICPVPLKGMLPASIIRCFQP